MVLEIIHQPVLVGEVLEYLKVGQNKNFIDGTLGEGGHAEKILNASGPRGKLLGLEQDAKSFKQAKERLKKFNNRAILVREDYRNLKKIYARQTDFSMAGILFDLGLSSLQLKDRSRGFSFMADGPLDMRFFDRANVPTAADILNSYDRDDLIKIFRSYAQVGQAERLADKVLVARARGAISTVNDLLEIINKASSHARQACFARGKSRVKRGESCPGGQPGQDRALNERARQIFQALRMEVNQEPEGIKKVLPQALEILEPGGRLAVISFHSVEDRLVKNFFQEQSRIGKLNIINKKPMTASDEEIKKNRRSSSAKLRVGEKL